MGIALTGVVIAIYWATMGLSTSQIGILITLGLLGGTCATLGVSLYADRVGRRKLLLLISLLSVGGGGALLMHPSFVILCGLTFLGMINGMGRDRMAASSLEQAILSSGYDVKSRTQTFAWYNVVLDVGHASGSFLGGLPFFLRHTYKVSDIASYQWTFLVYCGLIFLSGLFYFGLSKKVEIFNVAKEPISAASLKRVKRFAGISFLDSIGGGFLTNALVAYWFFKTFGVSEATIGTLFFTTRIANAFSHLMAAWLANRVGLLNTMVFSHIPSSLLLMCIPFMATFWSAAILYFIRECLVEMDVPTRQSYMASIVQPKERTFALGMVTVTRNFGWAVSPMVAGDVMNTVSFSTPFFIGPSIKIIYDLLMYTTFRKIHPDSQ